MSTAAISAKKTGGATEENVQSTRETVESVVVAFILAFLFRAFVAEAFVIPTGSMAPTLMGAHKDIFCEHCGQQYQASASDEFDSSTGARTGRVTVASTCSTCRGINEYNFVGNKDHSSFSGDRILVSKFDYVLSSPSRWDVFVFKYPLKARMNYIKRLVGLPGESLQIFEGDVMVKKGDEDPWVIARKPPHKIQAMKQVVADTKYQAEQLIEQGWPSLWQPAQNAAESSWTVNQTVDSWSAELAVDSEPQLIRYYHKTVGEEAWDALAEGNTLAPVDPYASQLITDYLAYNSSFVLADGTQVFDAKKKSWFVPAILSKGGWTPKDGITEEVSARDYAVENLGQYAIRRGAGDGHHWVADLSGKFEIEVGSDSGVVLLDLVEFGVHFQCSIDVATGAAMLQAIDASQELAIFGGVTAVTGKTPIRGPGSYSLEMANFDDQIVLWVNGKPIEFDKPAQFDSREYRNGTARRPYWTAEDPLDAAPVGIGGVNLSMKVNRAQVYRDIYYIAVQGGGSYSDYDLNDFRGMIRAVPDRSIRVTSTDEVIDLVYSHPEWWETTNLFSQRGYSEYELEEKQYFPMGDNSASSSDARAWWGHNFVEERYLLGKALLVFWPHTWNTPVPFTPHVSRMGMIR